jgi:three-Cys-motif partner protein
MAENSFFDGQKEQSLIKTRIVEKYFWSWAKVVMPTTIRISPTKPRIAYIDLFAGTGLYKDGSKSTPVKVLEAAVKDPDMRNMLVSMFNDANAENFNSLQQAITSISGIENLKYPPRVLNYEIGADVVKTFTEKKLIPTLLFIDPWGYKGLSRELIDSVIKDWGCDCIFFFNYNRINMGLNNSDVETHMNALFGKERADQVREELRKIPKKNASQKRESIIVEAIYEALKDLSGEFVHSFRFKHEVDNRTSHHLIFVSKNVKGYEIMKDIMAKESSSHIQGVPSYEYNPASLQQLEFLERPLDKLEAILLDSFEGKTLTMKEVYDQHHVGKPYISKNYKAALNNLEAQNKITAEPPANKRQKRNGEITFGASVKVIFPAKQ